MMQNLQQIAQLMKGRNAEEVALQMIKNSNINDPTISSLISSFVKLKDFLDQSLPGRYLVTMAGHITCVIDGVCYDTFDPSDRYIWCVYKVSE